MKHGIVDIIGKTVRGVIVKERDESPLTQVFFVFSDDTYFEIYGNDVQAISGFRTGGRQTVLQYMPKGKVVLDSFDETEAS